MSELKKGMELTPIKIMLKQPNTDGNVYPVPCLVYLKDEADKVIAHHKYKRCLAMADMCNAKYDEEDAKVNGCGASWEYISKEMKFWERWQKRWLKLADKFKEAK